jgi:hypothetical protein
METEPPDKPLPAVETIEAPPANLEDPPLIVTNPASPLESPDLTLIAPDNPSVATPDKIDTDPLPNCDCD